MSIDFTTYASALGELLIAGQPGVLSGLWIEGQRGAPTPGPEWHARPRSFDEVRRQLDEYFAGRRRRFELRLAPAGTAFQQAVWRELLCIPFGATRDYGELAVRLGRPSAARAVGGANGRNPISIVVPCHRVIGRAGDLRGYAGGEARKRWLLDHEGAGTEAVPPTRPGTSGASP
jgi:methylated-DNA-[protein]-cysteine S-methyltransferase